MFEVSSWVQSRLDNKIGFVELENQFGAVINWLIDGRVVKVIATKHTLIKLGSKLNTEDLNELIEMSLASKDEEWFFSLIGRLKNQEKRELAE